MSDITLYEQYAARQYRDSCSDSALGLPSITEAFLAGVSWERESIPTTTSLTCVENYYRC